MSISKYDDVIDSRDVIARIEELTKLVVEEDEAPGRTESEDDELTVLKKLDSAGREAASEWEDGATLVRWCYFTEYAQQLCEDIGDVPRDLPSYIEIDWEATARNIKTDYMCVDFDGVEYWVRS